MGRKLNSAYNETPMKGNSMFINRIPREPSGLSNAIDNLLSDMSSTRSDTEEYSKLVDQLVKLYPLKTEERPKRVSPDTLALIAGNLVGIILIVGVERGNVVASKAIGFVMKLRWTADLLIRHIENVEGV